MKKAFRFIFSRPFFTGLFIVLQLCALLLVVLVLNEYFLLFYAVSLLLGVVLVLYIVSRNGNPAYKIAWIIPILALPIFGTLLFLVFGRDTLTKRERQRMDYVTEKYAAAMAEATGARAMGIYKRDSYSGLNWSTVPSILVEMGFMSNPDEDRLLNDPEYQQKLVNGMVQGIADYMGRELGK